MFNTKFLKTLNESNDSSLYLTYIFSYKHNSYLSLYSFLFSVSIKFEACYITGKWGEFRIK